MQSEAERKFGSRKEKCVTQKTERKDLTAGLFVNRNLFSLFLCSAHTVCVFHVTRFQFCTKSWSEMTPVLLEEENAADSEFKSGAEKKYFEWTTACMVCAFQFLPSSGSPQITGNPELGNHFFPLLLVTCFRVYMSRHTVNFRVENSLQKVHTERHFQLPLNQRKGSHRMAKSKVCVYRLTVEKRIWYVEIQISTMCSRAILLHLQDQRKLNCHQVWHESE